MSRTRVVFVEPLAGNAFNSDAAGLEIDVGDRLLDACDEHSAPVLFSCRSGRCAACIVDVIRGAEALAPPSHEELETLQGAGGDASSRLACQLTIIASAATIDLRPRRPV